MFSSVLLKLSVVMTFSKLYHVPSIQALDHLIQCAPPPLGILMLHAGLLEFNIPPETIRKTIAAVILHPSLERASYP